MSVTKDQTSLDDEKAAIAEMQRLDAAIERLVANKAMPSDELLIRRWFSDLRWAREDYDNRLKGVAYRKGGLGTKQEYDAAIKKLDDTTEAYDKAQKQHGPKLHQLREQIQELEALLEKKKLEAKAATEAVEAKDACLRMLQYRLLPKRLKEVFDRLVWEVTKRDFGHELATIEHLESKPQKTDWQKPGRILVEKERIQNERKERREQLRQKAIQALLKENELARMIRDYYQIGW